jgi:hypothetical protein
LAFSENIRTTARLSDGNVVDKTGDEESPRELRIGLQGGDINGHGLIIGVGDGQGAEVCRGDAEVLREQLREWPRQVMPQSL